jgi:mRNA-degrading endonuclease RelE of RelBE toxin-antitoxin system
MWFARPLSNLKFGHYRFRIRDYRAIFDVVDDTIFVLAIKHRKDAY